MIDIVEQLEILSGDYESGDHVDISAFNYFQLALDEIGCLQAENAQHDGCKRSLERVIEENTAKAEEIERLRDDAIHNEGVMVALREGYTEAKARVEELEADVRFYRDGDVQDSTDPVMLRAEIDRLKDDIEGLQSRMWELTKDRNFWAEEARDGE